MVFLIKFMFFFFGALFSINCLSDDDITAEDFTGRLSYDVPQSAGFALLGVSPDKIVDPQGGRDLALSLMQGLDGNGNFQSGFALETRPYLWSRGKYTSESKIFDRILSGLKVSFASTTGLDEVDKANRYGLGVNFSYQFSDPLYNKDYLTCVSKANDKVIPKIPSENWKEGKAMKKKLLSAEVNNCQNAHLSWTTTSIAFGVSGHKAEEKEQELDMSGAGMWLTGSYALSDHSEVTGHIRVIDNQLSVVDGILQQSDNSVVALRYRFGSKSLRGVIESSWNEDKTNSGTFEYQLALIGTEFKVTEGMWFRLAFGKQYGDDNNEKNDSIFSGQMRFAFGGEPLSSL
jgi:hypothetical protein